MAKINCEECGRVINDNASVCPNCGFPLPIKKVPAGYYDFITVKADTVDNALTKACEQLNELPINIEFEVVDFGKKSFFTKRDAIIRVRRREN